MRASRRAASRSSEKSFESASARAVPPACDGRGSGVGLDTARRRPRRVAPGSRARRARNRAVGCYPPRRPTRPRARASGRVRRSRRRRHAVLALGESQRNALARRMRTCRLSNLGVPIRDDIRGARALDIEQEAAAFVLDPAFRAGVLERGVPHPACGQNAERQQLESNDCARWRMPVSTGACSWGGVPFRTEDCAMGRPTRTRRYRIRSKPRAVPAGRACVVWPVVRGEH